MRVKRSGVITEGRAFLISPSICLMYCCMVGLLVSTWRLLVAF